MNVRRFFQKAVASFAPELRVTARSLPYLLEKRSAEATADYICNNMALAEPFETRADLYGYVFERAPKEGLVLEFGVKHGNSLNRIAALTERVVHGFDSFEGLPDDGLLPKSKQAKWHVAKGDIGGKLPSVASNVLLHKGWFDKTLPEFVCMHNEAIAFIHIDVDIYSSTKTILEKTADRLRPGTVIVFDEYFNYVGWQAHEYRAFKEFVRDRGVVYKYLAYTYDQAAVAQIVSIGDQACAA